MKKRRSERISVQIKVTINIDGESYSGYIYNVSQEGAYLNIITAPAKIVANFIHGTKIELKFQTNTVKEIAIQCEIKWGNISTESDVGIIYMIGVEIIDSPDEYKEFLMTLQVVLQEGVSGRKERLNFNPVINNIAFLKALDYKAF